MKKVVQCVPNFSEGRRPEVIDAIAEAAAGTPGASLLDVDPDADYNRCVLTIVGDPDSIVEAALAASAKAALTIDMSMHHGGHPRIGAIDVVPFVPVRGVSMQDCVQCARSYAERLAESLDIPVYLYEKAATVAQRQSLADVRLGQYEALQTRLSDPAHKPDFGPSRFNPRLGATAVGARNFLVAYNVNLDRLDLATANEIALTLRESGRIKRDEHGEAIIGPNGKKERIPGRLSCVKGLGVALEDAGFAQVSMNLTDFNTTPLHLAYEECCKEAKRLGLRVTGSEVVGLLPVEALLQAGRYYLPEETNEDRLVECAIERLGLNDFNPFDPSRKIIENRMSSK